MWMQTAHVMKTRPDYRTENRTNMTFKTSDQPIDSEITVADASFLLGWAFHEILSHVYPDRVRSPNCEEEWLRGPGHTIFVPVGEAAPVSDFANSILPAVEREIERQLATVHHSDDWFVELDYWAHAMSGDSESLLQGLRFDVVVQVRG